MDWLLYIKCRRLHWSTTKDCHHRICQKMWQMKVKGVWWWRRQSTSLLKGEYHNKKNYYMDESSKVDSDSECMTNWCGVRRVEWNHEHEHWVHCMVIRIISIMYLWCSSNVVFVLFTVILYHFLLSLYFHIFGRAPPEIKVTLMADFFKL